MAENDILLGGTGSKQILLNAGMANRHGLITGATGTGKTVTLQVLAESFSRLGVPVFTADVKGDLWALPVPARRTRRSTSGCNSSVSRVTPSRRARRCSGMYSEKGGTRCAPQHRRWAPPC